MRKRRSFGTHPRREFSKIPPFIEVPYLRDLIEHVELRGCADVEPGLGQAEAFLGLFHHLAGCGQEFGGFDNACCRS